MKNKKGIKTDIKVEVDYQFEELQKNKAKIIDSIIGEAQVRRVEITSALVKEKIKEWL